MHQTNLSDYLADFFDSGSQFHPLSEKGVEVMKLLDNARLEMVTFFFLLTDF